MLRTGLSLELSAYGAALASGTRSCYCAAMPPRKIAAFALFVVFAGASVDGQRFQAGAAATSCGNWVELETTRDKGEETLILSWVQGFLFGSALMTRRLPPAEVRVPIETLPDVASIKLWLSSYCRQHPLENIAVAALHLFSEVTKK